MLNLFPNVVAALIDRKVAGGFLGFGALAIFGVRLLVRGIRNDIYDWLGHSTASRGWFIFTGVLFQLPLIAWVIFLVRQGWFERWSSP